MPPIVEWLKDLRQTNCKKLFLKIAALPSFAWPLLGHELRRPEADYLCNGIHETAHPFWVRSTIDSFTFFHGQTVLPSSPTV